MTDNAQKKKKNKGGRPTIYNQELADLICMRVATNTMGLGRLCKQFDDMPNMTTVYEWRYKYPEFSKQYAEAKLRQADLMAEELLEISDDGTNDYVASKDPNNPGYKANGEHIQRSRLRVDTRKWLASKLLPKQYGAHVDRDAVEDKSLVEKLIDKIADK